MHPMKYRLSALAAASLLAPSAYAQSADDVVSLRRDIESMRQEYEQRITDLEARLARAEADAASSPAASAPVSADALITVDNAVSEPPPIQAVNANPNIYNPGIAVALNGFFTAARNDTGEDAIAGFATGDEIGRPARGFSLGESEVSFAANIDPSLAGFLAVAVGAENDVGVEEAYVRTTALPGGLSVKAGRFLSGVAYLNERHAHDWSFSDAPLPYRAFLNTQLGDDGVQLRWIAPTEQYLEFGAEALRGESYPASGAAGNGVGAYSAFVRTGADFNASSSYLAGLSVLHARSLDRASGGDLFSGDTDLGVLTLVYKWAPNGNPVVHNLTVAGEYFQSVDEGRYNGLDLSQSHSGWYVQGVYQFMPQWSAGLRVAGLEAEDPGAAFAGTQLDAQGRTPFDYTALLEFDTSEFGRLRLQYSRDDAGFDPNDIFTLQYTVIYGPHGAHRY